MEFANVKSSKENFLNNAKAARNERMKEKNENRSAILIQAYFRRYLVYKRLKKTYINEFDQENLIDENGKIHFIEATKAFKLFQKFLFAYDENQKEKFDTLCKYIIASMFDSDLVNSDFKIDYTSVCLEKKLTSFWINQVKKILILCLHLMKQTRLELIKDQTSMMLYLNILINLTSCKTWKIFQKKSQINDPLFVVVNRFCSNILDYLVKNNFYSIMNEVLMKSFCKNRLTIKKPALIAAITLSLRPTFYSDLNNQSLIFLIKNILTVPGLFYQVSIFTNDNLTLINNELLIKCLSILNDDSFNDELFKNSDANLFLFILGNIVQICYIKIKVLHTDEKIINDFVSLIKKTLNNCKKFVNSNESSFKHWHPILGWYSHNIDQRYHDSFQIVKNQLKLLWSDKIINLLYRNLLDDNFLEIQKNETQFMDASLKNSNNENLLPAYKNLFRRAANFVIKTYPISDTLNGSLLLNYNNSFKNFSNKEIFEICSICSTYIDIMKTLSLSRLDILTNICYQEKILMNLWEIIWLIGGKNNINFFINCIETNPEANSPEIQLLVLVCDCSSHLIKILDDKELYENQKPFKVQDLIKISSFLNYLIFHIIYIRQIDFKATTELEFFFNSIHTLLILLYYRNSIRNFTPKDHWLIKEIRINSFMKELENGKKHSQLLINKIPHIIPHKERVILFRKFVAKEKEILGLNDPLSDSINYTLITVHRSRILEDSYQRLNILKPKVLKGTIRVKFINEQGLSEVGIDQNGVFKEFLEETMKKFLDPSLNLFAVTTEQRLYPSPTSNLHENYLSLFEFAGKMLGKAVYEGIVIDAPFASFFLNQLLPQIYNINNSQSGNTQEQLYSSLDQLSSLDPELHKSLTYIKHYEGDVADLNLTFSVDENYLGKIVTYELKPGGKSINLTKDNKISYVHLMAHFRMHKQIDKQSNAFVKGFCSIITPEWLTMFSTPELQRLISGDNIPIDLNDLRRHTKYYGGFHNNHRLINWFWDILQNDFSNEELGLFLKFVTSCSKPPLLGFAHLHPPFSIRCVEVSEDLDIGDTVGSVVRGFLTISTNGRFNKGKRSENSLRLPSSSTCFNLLKLPNYQKKSILKEKLRYAINSNTGFELS